MRKGLLIALALFLSGCHDSKLFMEGNTFCPQVQIMRDSAYLTQYVNFKETFQINLSGYEGMCYYEQDVERYRAIIRPIFKIKRLTPSDETDVRFSYYTETLKGPAADLGKKTHYLNAQIPLNQQEIEYKAPAVQVYIPTEEGGEYDVNLGIWQSPEEKLYNQRTFDINYRYIDE